MQLTIDFSPADIVLMQERATATNVNIEDYVRKTVLKETNNSAYLSKLEMSREQIRNGQVVTFSDEEWERFIDAKDIQ